MFLYVGGLPAYLILQQISIVQWRICVRLVGRMAVRCGVEGDVCVLGGGDGRGVYDFTG